MQTQTGKFSVLKRNDFWYTQCFCFVDICVHILQDLAYFVACVCLSACMCVFWNGNVLFFKNHVVFFVYR